ncbi:hypothetical protein CXB51_006067 [Gossypium anomalum]|uniref:Uncharacterized protein n=1 Tax=Gossypium anomalum TaxID=47600 RepID=A0A8J5Z377_9ROSI|nr:hypothetical protein CXB51_006067 [Gossypium anomalum]
MDKDLANLSLDDKEDEVLQAQRDPESYYKLPDDEKHDSKPLAPSKRGPDFISNGKKMDLERVLKGSLWTFNNYLLLLHWLAEGEDSLRVSLIYVNYWVQIHRTPTGFYTENLAHQIREFLRGFLEFDRTNLGKGLETLRKKEEDHVFDWDDFLYSVSIRAPDFFLFLLLPTRSQELTEMNHDLEDTTIIGGDGKKLPRREGVNLVKGGELGSLIVKSRKETENNPFISAAANRQANRSQ